MLNSQKNFEDMVEERLVPEVINGLVVAKRHVRTTFSPVVFSSTDFWVALECVTWFPNLTQPKLT